MGGVDVAFSASSLLGPNGGLIGLAYAAGAGSCWFFMQRTVFKIVTREREACEKRLAALEEQVRELNDRYTAGLERQLWQVRESTYQVFWGDRIDKYPK